MGKRAAVVICDEGQLFREGLASLLQRSKFRIHAVYSDYDDMEQKLSTSNGEMLFLIGRQTATSADLQRISAFKQAHPGSHVVLLVDSCSEKHRWEAAGCGLDGVLMKSISAEVLCLSIELVLRSQSVFIVDPDSGTDGEPPNDGAAITVRDDKSAPQGEAPAARELPASLSDTNGVLQELASPLQNVMVSSRREGLSDRELEILDCLVKGHSNKVIARRCNITEATVKVHLKAILRKISVANRTQAAVWAINRMHRMSAPANGLSRPIAVLPIVSGADARSEPSDIDDLEHVPMSVVETPATLSRLPSRAMGTVSALHR